jgi:hypothetical protein
VGDRLLATSFYNNFLRLLRKPSLTSDFVTNHGCPWAGRYERTKYEENEVIPFFVYFFIRLFVKQASLLGAIP